MKKNYVCLYRISTINDTKIKGKKAKINHQTGLGLDAQQNALVGFIERNDGVLLHEFKEYESAVNKERISYNSNISLDTMLAKRPVLQEALQYAKDNNAMLLVKEVSRLTRNKLLGEYLMATGVKFVCSDYPNDDKFMLSMRINMEHENASKISERTSLALQAKIKKTGKWQKASKPMLNGTAQKNSVKVRQRKALNNENNIRSASMIALLKKDGLSYHEIAKQLNESKYRTSKGCSFSYIQVKRIEERF